MHNFHFLFHLCVDWHCGTQNVYLKIFLCASMYLIFIGSCSTVESRQLYNCVSVNTAVSQLYLIQHKLNQKDNHIHVLVLILEMSSPLDYTKPENSSSVKAVETAL